MLNINEIISYFPKRIGNEINKNLLQDKTLEGINLLEEIRIRVSKPVILKYTNNEHVLETLIVTQEEIIEILGHICNNSIYSYQNQICNGYITLKGRT